MSLRAIAAISLAAILSVAPATSSSAQTLTSETRDLRSDVSQTIETYVTKYGNRVSAVEKSQLINLAREADRELLKVQRAISKADRIPSSQRSKKMIAINAALRAHTAAEKRADTSFASARSILEPKLSLFESLDALRDYNRLMNSYEELEAGLTAERSTLR